MTVALEEPNATASPDAVALKFVPVIVTEFPPAGGPLVGLIDEIVGGELYVYLSALLVADVWPSESVTVTSTVPEPAGAVAVIDVPEPTVTPVADAEPNLTVSPEANPLPVMVTGVPPACGPLDGLTAVTAGGGT